MLGFGEKHTPVPFVTACERFVYTENLRSGSCIEGTANENKSTSQRESKALVALDPKHAQGNENNPKPKTQYQKLKKYLTPTNHPDQYTRMIVAHAKCYGITGVRVGDNKQTAFQDTINTLAAEVYLPNASRVR